MSEIALPTLVLLLLWSTAVGVDLDTNEVFLQDENLFGFMVFDRMTNTPPSRDENR